MKTTTAITTVKRDVKLQEWMEQIKAAKRKDRNSILCSERDQS